MKLIFGTLLGFFISGCSAQDLSTYTDINNTESRKNPPQKNFEITKITDYFYVTNSKNENQIIAYYLGHLYKFDQRGNLIDTLDLVDKSDLRHYEPVFDDIAIQPENYFIYLGDGYFPNWIKTGDKTKHKYNKVYNQDLTMEADVLEQYHKDRRSISNKSETERWLKEKEVDDDLAKKAEDFELLKLIKRLNGQADYHQEITIPSSSPYLSSFFVIGSEVIKVNIPIELKSHSRKITGKKELKMVIPEFTEKQEYFHFEKMKWLKGSSGTTISHGYSGNWRGNAYYNIQIGENTLKIKVETSKGKSKTIDINRNIFPDNKYFILIKTINGIYFIKEKLDANKHK